MKQNNGNTKPEKAKEDQSLFRKEVKQDNEHSKPSNSAKPERAKEDQGLVVKAMNGDQLAYGRLLERYKDSIFFMVLKMVNNKEDAEDLTIEAFGKAFSNIEKYSPKFAFSTWLFKIAVNNCIDFIRKKRLEKSSLDEKRSNGDGTEYSIDVKSPELDPEETYIKEQRKALANEVVDRLPEHYRNLIHMRYFDELSYNEIAAKLALPLGTVKAQLHRSKELLYNILKKGGDNY